MAKIRTYQCPGTDRHPSHSFDFLHHPSDEPGPRFCPACGFDSDGLDLTAAITMPHVSAGHGKAMLVSANQTYRQMEEGSAHRAAVAGEMTGEDASGLKITNLKDNLQQGEIAAMDPPPNPVSDAMKVAPNIFGFRDGQNGAGFGAAAHTGVAPHAGARASAAVQAFHSEHGHQIVRNGEKGRH